MILAMSILARDEASLIRHNIAFHRRMGVDCFVITDNRSLDGTREILEELSRIYPITLIDEPEHVMKQDEWVMRMARVAAEDLRADWIINGDADEFWHTSRGSLKAEILDSAGVLLCSRSNMLADRETLESPDYVFCKNILRVARPFEDHRPYQERPGELSECPVIMTRIRKKVMCRLAGLRSIGYGNHDAEHEGPAVVSDGVHVYHYPVRSFAEFQTKVLNHGTSLKNNPAIPKHFGWHVRRWYLLYEKGLLEQEYARLALDAPRVRQYLDSGALVIDKTLFNEFAQL